MAAEDATTLNVRSFLEDVPPGRLSEVSDLAGEPFPVTSVRKGAHLYRPDIFLFCSTERTCEKMQMFQSKTDVTMVAGAVEEAFITYVCRNCGRTQKTYAVWVQLHSNLTAGSMYKFGEHPQFGPPNSPRLISLFRDDKETFLKGRRSENQALGVGAFAYYRRVIESQKNRLFEKIIAVCKLYNASPELLNELEAAKSERQFTKAIEAVKHGLPDALLIGGQNPITLLHDALSEGLHAETDEECLEIATDIRVVMAAFAERLAEALRDEGDLKQSVSRLIKKKQSRSQAPAALPS